MSILHDHPILLGAEEIRAALGPTVGEFPTDRTTSASACASRSSRCRSTRCRSCGRRSRRSTGISAAYQVSVVLIDSSTPRGRRAGAAPGRRRPRRADHAGPRRRRSPTLTEIAVPDPRFSVELGDTSCSADTTSPATAVRCACAIRPGPRQRARPLADAAAARSRVRPRRRAAAADWPAGVYTVSVARHRTGGATESSGHERGAVALAPRILTISPEPGRRDAPGEITLTVDVRARSSAAPAGRRS